MAKITFLGTAGDMVAMGRQLRRSGGIVMEFGGNQLHIDPGPGALAGAKEAGVDLRKNVGVLVTSNRLHVSGGISETLSAMSYGGIDPHGVLLAAPSVLEESAGSSPAVPKQYLQFAERAISFENTPRVGINDIDIRVLPAHAKDQTAVGLRITAGKFSVSYTGLTGFTPQVAEAHKGATVLIASLVEDDEEDIEKYFALTPETVRRFIDIAKPKVVILTHFGEKLLKRDLRDVGRAINKDVAADVLVAEDGFTFESASYA